MNKNQHGQLWVYREHWGKKQHCQVWSPPWGLHSPHKEKALDMRSLGACQRDSNGSQEASSTRAQLAAANGLGPHGTEVGKQQAGSPVPGILQARTLEWVAISFSNAWKWKVKVKSLSRARLLATPWTAAYQAPLSMGFSRQEYWSGVPLPSPHTTLICIKFCRLILKSGISNITLSSSLKVSWVWGSGTRIPK